MKNHWKIMSVLFNLLRWVWLASFHLFPISSPSFFLCVSARSPSTFVFEAHLVILCVLTGYHSWAGQCLQASVWTGWNNEVERDKSVCPGCSFPSYNFILSVISMVPCEIVTNIARYRTMTFLLILITVLW